MEIERIESVLQNGIVWKGRKQMEQPLIDPNANSAIA